MIFGINSTKGAILIAETDGAGGTFMIGEIHRINYASMAAADLLELLQDISTVLKKEDDDVSHSVAILKCSGGSYGSSVEAIKAEAVVQIAASQLGYTVCEVAPQSLKKTLKCAQGQTWQKRAKELLNPDGEYKYWSTGTDGAACAAYKVAEM